MDLMIKPSQAEVLQNQLQQLAAEALPGKIKLIIYKNIEILKNHTKPFANVREDMFKQFGTPVNGDYAITKFTGERNDIPNPKLEEYLTQIEQVDVAIEIKDIQLLPTDIFTGDRVFSGDLSMVYEKLLA